MKTLRARFNLVLSLVLIMATLLPLLIIYLLSESGLVEAAYISEVTDPRQRDQLRIGILQDMPLFDSGRVQYPVLENSRLAELMSYLSGDRAETVQPWVNLLFDPETGAWTGLVTKAVERIVFTSPIFKFRVDLPAWIVIGSLPLFGLLLGFILSMVLSRSVTRPVAQLAEAARAVGKRELGYRVEAKGSQELVDLARSFNRMAEELESAETNRRNLMADVAHELRTPLTVLEGNLRAILDGVRELSEEEIALLYEQSHHLNRLVDDLRELSLAEAAQLSLDCQEVNLALLVKETVAHFDLVAQEKGIQLTAKLDESLVHPCLDENRIRQVLHNLLSNAFRYTPRGGRVAISAKRSADSSALEISVTDNGAGIPPKELRHIFDRFYRAKTASGSQPDGTKKVLLQERPASASKRPYRRNGSTQNGGSGLGLAIAKAIVELHGGQIRARSKGAGKGSTFSFSLPFNRSSS